ncbi:Glycosyltransferase, GT2 family [Clostridium cavendishii DSM 21758]|uniref:Glycosyltransferase, GT2 family n=1 Tax=Clostridium cavendishii DSM 21758 TaxID=1121302 RepID=A0A1M6JG06_9CLOT|nr:bifunctional glycosyltransferase family 2 protein/class I SAM-dependent methyltransferase [Clostridium cavendishii]SHJ45605.1 Glycosyltransferase, GT2 family [Clostridium cavendishii DSM 21758]
MYANTETINFIKDYNYQTDNKDMKFTSIVIATYNQLDYTKLCIESIRKFTPKENYEIIIVDNNSTDNTVNWLRKQTDLKVIYNIENKGFPTACNQGIEISKGDSILLLNNDTVVTPNWLNNLQRALYSSEDIGGVGAISNYCSNYQQIPVFYKEIDELLKFASEINKSNSNLWENKVRLIGYCYMIKREVIDKVGMLDEIFTPGNFEDDDISFRIINEGYKLLLCKDVFIHHFGSVSFGKEANKFSNIIEINRNKFKEKWGFDAYYSANIRFDIISLITSEVNDKINVLEIGCGVGNTLLEIKNRYRNANLYGIESCEKSAQISSKLCNSINGDIESIDLPYQHNYFDYIIFSDVLEHLVNPWGTLEKLRKYLKEDGYILASIPNVMHISVLNNLINGRFRYEDSGILDKTHLRFFTLAEIEDLFNSTGFNIIYKATIQSPPNIEEEKLLNSLYQIVTSDLKDQYTVYQYLVKANKNIYR